MIRSSAAVKASTRSCSLDAAVAVVADSWWQANKALAALDIVWDEGECGNVTSDGIARVLRSGLAGKDAGVGRKNGDVTAGLARATRRSRGRIRRPVPRSRHDGAAELHCPCARRPGRNLGADAERRSFARRRCPCRRRAAAQRDRAQDHARRRLRPARPAPGLRSTAVQIAKDVGRPVKLSVVARRRHPPRLLPSGGDGRMTRGARRRWNAGRVECPHRRPVHHRQSSSRGRRRQAFSGRLSGGHALRRPELLRRFCDADHTCAGRRSGAASTTRRTLLQGMLRRRNGARGRHGSLPVSAQAAGQHPRVILAVLDAAADTGRMDEPRRRTCIAASRSTSARHAIRAAWSKSRSRDGSCACIAW